MRQTFLMTAILGAAVVSLAGGCGPQSGAGLVQARGTITYNGQPLTQGSISFIPTGTTGGSAAGNIDSEGHYTLSTLKAGDGIAPGTYQVRIESWASPPRMDETGTHPGKPAIPERYFDLGRSGLTATVESKSEPQEINFDLLP